jgi:hypothetical protein
MPDFRTHSKISERNDLRWFTRTVSLRRWYWRLSCTALLLSAVVLVGFVLAGDERVYWSAPVSSSHAMFQQDCKQCHVQQGAPLTRLVSLNDSHHSVRDADCQACHAQHSHDHAPRMQKSMVTGCVECHREHVGRETLADVADQHCTQCHANLEVTSGSHIFAQQVPAFDQHPEFLPWQPLLEEHLRKQRDDLTPLAVEATGNAWQDRTKLKFNHATHLVEVGVLTVPPGPEHKGKHAERKQLACADCHQPDAAGQYMQPINYKQHCASCHTLEYTSQMAGGPLPHETPDIVYGVLRERFMKYADANPEEWKSKEESPRLPNKQAEATAKDKWTFVEQKMSGVEAEVFKKEVQNGCAYCHEWVTPDPAKSGDLAFVIVPPNIPQRWFVGSRFDHRRHREVSCVVCHDPKYDPEGKTPHVTKGGLATQVMSERSSDVLMPRVQTCQTCHGEQPKNGQVVGARARCIDCHDYHAPHGPPGSKLDAWAKPDR